MNVSTEEIPIEELRIQCENKKREYLHAIKELEQTKQEAYEYKRQLKAVEATQQEYQQEIETLHSHETELEQVKLLIQKRRNEISELKQSNNETVLRLEAEISLRNKEIEQLQAEVKEIREGASKVANENVEGLRDKNFELKAELELLKEQDADSLVKLDGLKNQNVALKEQLQILKFEVECLTENFTYKQQELSEVNCLINALQNDMTALKAEMEAAQTKPNGREGKTESLFAEVDDKRTELQRLLQGVKTKYGKMKAECEDLRRSVSVLRGENVEIKERWDADRLEMDVYDERYSSAWSHIETLHCIVASYKKELADTQQIIKNESKRDFIFWENLFKKQCEEIEALKEELSSKTLRHDLLCSDLHCIQDEMAKLKTGIVGLKKELERLTLGPEHNLVDSLVYNDDNKCETSGESQSKYRIENKIDYSRLKEYKKDCLSMTRVINDVFNTEEKENTMYDLPEEKSDRFVTEEKENIVNDLSDGSKHVLKTRNAVEEVRNDVSASDCNISRHVASAEENAISEKSNKILVAPLRKGLKILKSKPVFIPCPKK